MVAKKPMEKNNFVNFVKNPTLDVLAKGHKVR
jgi:hypothetical protein